MKPLWLFTDGASRGNPGPAAIGYVVTDDAGAVLAKHAECIGTATNNEAEYRALIAGLEAAAKSGSGYLSWVSDAETVVRQMEGKYRVRKAHLKPLHEQATRAMDAFAHVVIEHRKREDARIAEVDGIVNDALDECTSS
ncbi:MAG: ribonuclease HI family protein [Longimicrobiales bacterium]